LDAEFDHPMARSRPTYIWLQPRWPGLHYDTTLVGDAVSKTRRAQGLVEGKLAVLGFEQRLELAAEAWSQEAVATAAIEGERLDLAAVRSSVARRLGVGKQDGPNALRTSRACSTSWTTR
jgi:Fic family protein